jgi:hypothetical protein
MNRRPDGIEAFVSLARDESRKALQCLCPWVTIFGLRKKAFSDLPLGHSNLDLAGCGERAKE